jgi:hypothetical protein
VITSCGGMGIAALARGAVDTFLCTLDEAAHLGCAQYALDAEQANGHETVVIVAASTVAIAAIAAAVIVVAPPSVVRLAPKRPTQAPPRG